jgi:hypothetical protein
MTVESNFTPQTLSAREYVLALFEPSDNVAVLLRHRDRRQTLQRITSAETIVHPTFQAWLAERNRSGADVFIGMNPLKEAASSRTKSSIKEIRHVYLDLDENARDSLWSLRDSTDVPPPNFVLDTSPGKHQVVWKVEAIDQEQAESLQRSMANQFGGDPAATDSTRVLRLPGYVNRKYRNQDFVVRVLRNPTTSIISTISQSKTIRTVLRVPWKANGTKPPSAATRVNPNTIGLTRSAPCPEETIRNPLFNESRIFVPTTNLRQSITRV